MSKLSDALAAMDKATPGPWEMGENVRGFYHIWGKKHEWVGQIHALPEKSHNDATLIAAAPDALAWIKEALPVVMGRAGEVRCDLDPIFGASKYNDPELRAEDEAYLARLDALIARAKPEEVGR